MGENTSSRINSSRISILSVNTRIAKIIIIFRYLHQHHGDEQQ